MRAALGGFFGLACVGLLASCRGESTVRKAVDDRPPVKTRTDDPLPSFRLVELHDESFEMTVVDRDAYAYTIDAPRTNEAPLLWRLDGQGLTKLPYPLFSGDARPAPRIVMVTGHFPDDLVIYTGMAVGLRSARCLQWSGGAWLDAAPPCSLHYPWGDGRVVRYEDKTKTFRFRDGSPGPTLAASNACHAGSDLVYDILVHETIGGHTIAMAYCDGQWHLHHWSRGESAGHPFLDPPWFETEGARFAASPSGDLYAFGSSRRFLGKLEGSTFTELAIDPQPAGQIVALAVLSSGRMIAAFGRTDLQIGPPADLWTRSAEGTWSHLERAPGGDGRSFTVQGLVALGDKVWLSVRIEGNSKSPRGNALFVSP